MLISDVRTRSPPDGTEYAAVIFKMEIGNIGQAFSPGVNLFLSLRILLNGRRGKPHVPRHALRLQDLHLVVQMYRLAHHLVHQPVLHLQDLHLVAHIYLAHHLVHHPETP